jgi:PAS domain S-box-containing protein
VLVSILNSSPFTIFASAFLGVALSALVVALFRVRDAIRGQIEGMARELLGITQTLAVANYDNRPAMLKPFYDALTAVKHYYNEREFQRKDILDIAHSVAQNMEFEKLLRELMPKLAQLIKSNCCAFYTVNQSTGKLILKHSIGFGKNIYGEFDLTLGEGFIGHIALKEDTTIITKIPDDTIYTVRTFLGKLKPRSLMVVPIKYLDQLNGILVCASIYDYTEDDRARVDLLKYYLGVAVGNGVNYEKNKRLTNELVFQNKLIQDQYEEMRKQLADRERLLGILATRLSGACFFVTDDGGKVLFFSRGAEALYGIKAESAVGRNIAQVHAERGWPPVGDIFKDAADGGEHCIWMADGEGRRRFEMCLSRLSDGDAQAGIFVDIKEVG